MTEQPLIESDESLSVFSKHRMAVLISVTIVISLALVSIALVMYNLSGAAQLDLSRPGYKSVSNQVVDESDNIIDYSAFGPVNESTINEFKTIFDGQATSASAVDAFGGDPLNAKKLGIEQSTDE